MSTSKLDQARAWAESVGKMEGLHPESLATVDVIRALPNIVVDGEEIITIYDKYRDDAITLHEAFRAAVALAIPPLPTLAELIEAGNNPEDYQWVWADTDDGLWLITMVGDVRDKHSYVMDKDGCRFSKGWSQLRPRPGGPKLEWPDDDDDHESEYCLVCGATLLDDGPECEHCREDVALPSPEDVPPGEAWQVKYDGLDWVGARESDEETKWPWSLALLNGADYSMARDSEITLVSRLVPKTP